jgi:hypothetical protein
MKTLTILELSKIYNLNRQTIYNKINKGILSKNSDNKIDLAEAIRVFGEPTKKQAVKEPVKIDNPESTENLLLRQQIDMLKNQLEDAKNRESFYQNQIETMQRLLEAPKLHKVEDSIPPEEAITENTVMYPIDQAKDEGLTTNTKVSKKENKRIPVPEHVEPEPKKRGVLSRFFLPNG